MCYHTFFEALENLILNFAKTSGPVNSFGKRFREANF